NCPAPHRRHACALQYPDDERATRESQMKAFIATAMLACALAGPAWAGGGNIAGTESAGIPTNNSVYSPGINQNTGKMPGYYGYGYQESAPAQPRVYKKKKKSHRSSGNAGN